MRVVDLDQYTLLQTPSNFDLYKVNGGSWYAIDNLPQDDAFTDYVLIENTLHHKEADQNWNILDPTERLMYLDAEIQSAKKNSNRYKIIGAGAFGAIVAGMTTASVYPEIGSHPASAYVTPSFMVAMLGSMVISNHYDMCVDDLSKTKKQLQDDMAQRAMYEWNALNE